MKTVFLLVVWFHLAIDADGPDKPDPRGMTTVGPFASQQHCDNAATVLQMVAGDDAPMRHLCVEVLADQRLP